MRRNLKLEAKVYKWADYCVSEIKYQKGKKRIQQVTAHLDLDCRISDPFILTRRALIEKLQAGESFALVYWYRDDILKVRHLLELREKGGEVLMKRLEK